jgi:protein-arginine deiminase
MLEQAVEAAYARAEMRVEYVDDLLSHHVGAGEVHCGSNTLRQTETRYGGSRYVLLNSGGLIGSELVL